MLLMSVQLGLDRDLLEGQDGENSAMGIQEAGPRVSALDRSHDRSHGLGLVVPYLLRSRFSGSIEYTRVRF